MVSRVGALLGGVVVALCLALAMPVGVAAAAGSGRGATNFLLVATTPATLGTATAAARELGGKVLTNWPEIGVAVVSSRRPNLASLLRGEPGVDSVGATRDLAAVIRQAVADAEDDPILGALGQESRHLGAPGTAAAAKLAFNLLLGAQVAALAEAVALGVATGIDREQILDAIAGSGFSSPVLAFRAEFMRARRYEPAAFRSRLMLKDLRNALDDASGAGHRLPVTGAVADAFAATVDAGAGDQDAAVLVETFLDSPSRKDALR